MKIYVPTKNGCSLVTEERTLLDNFVEANRSAEFVDSAECADIIVLFEEFSFKLWGYAETLKGERLVREYPGKVFTINYDDCGRGYLPGCYTSLNRRNFDPAVHRPCSYPRTYNEYAAAASDPEAGVPHASRLLFSFAGTTRSHPVRKIIVGTLSGCERSEVDEVDQTFHHHTQDEKVRYVRQVVRSSFVLCPRGWSPSTYRLFEVMALGRCPVIISDNWVPLEGIDWRECSIRVRESEVSRIPAILKEREADAARLGASARKVWEEHFTTERKNKYYLRAIGELYKRRSAAASITFEGLCATWRSWEFYWSNGWTLPQRIRGKMSRVINNALQ